jgi:hypothetical protein
MAIQYLAIVEETTRGTDPTSGYLFLPVMNNIQPTVEYDDQPRKEFRGADTALGDSSVVRRSGRWTMSIECAYYPGAETGLFIKHCLGKSVTRTVVDTSAYEGIIYPLANLYGTGAELADKAIGIVPNTDEGGTTKSQYYGGGRVTSIVFTGEGTDDVKLTIEVQGPAEYIGAVDQTATAGASFPAAAPFSTDDCLLYIGAGITRTGTAPDFTAIAPNTMPAYKPDSFTITLTNGLDDKTVMDGVLGPNKTFRSAQFSATAATPIDYEDPSSGFSSADQFKTIFGGPQTTSLLIVMDNGEAAGDTTTNYSTKIDLANLLFNPDTPQRQSDGTQPTVAFNFESLYDDTAEYPAALFTVDKASAY